MNNSQNSTMAVKPATLAFWSIKSLIFQIIMITAAVTMPVLAHLLGAPVRILLPMHWPVLLAGLAYGWRAGLLVGLLSPIVSYSISGFPLPPMLPPMTLELGLYGFLAGFLCERVRLNRFISLAVSLLVGRLAFVAAVIVTSAVIFNSQYIQTALLPGMIAAIAQIALLPLIASWWINKSGK